MSGPEVRVRIAPSPSGYLHVGTARTAIFNFLFARHHGGKFLVRIEDTDAQRSDSSLVEPILDALRWLELDWDEEIIYQSQRTERYKEFVLKLIESGNAYRCFCDQETIVKERDQARAEKRNYRYDSRCFRLSETEITARLEAKEPYSVRLKIPEGETTYRDMVVGDVTRQNQDIEDFIIARTDGTAVYNLAVVIDDHEMRISHVIRGNDHITNSFKQIHIYRALGWKIPTFGHVPLILRPDKKKVSKRLGDKDVGEYRGEGFLPDALFNYLCLLGWSPKTDREIYTRKELIEIFDERNFNPSNAVFDEDKLVAFNKEHIGLMSAHDLATLVAPLLVKSGCTTKDWLEARSGYLRQVVELLKEKVRRLEEFVTFGSYFFSFDYKYDETAAGKHFSEESAMYLSELADRFEALESFEHDDVEKAITDMAAARELKKAKLIHPTRLAVSGIPVGPSLYAMLVVLTKRIAVERMRRAAEHIQHLRKARNGDSGR